MLLAADVAELTADPEASAVGFVLESTQDARRGASATLIVKDGSLSLGTFVVAGDAYAPVRFIEDFRGERTERALPSEPAQISGFNKLPDAGTTFSIVANKKEAESRAKEAASVALPARAVTAAGMTELPLIIKADVAGSVDAIAHELSKLTHDRVAIRIVSSGVGNVSENDVKTARAAGGVIIAFNVPADPVARDLAEREGVALEFFTIIYKLTERIAERLTERAPSVETETELGRAVVLKAFSSSAKKQVMGARLVSGAFAVGNRIKLFRQTEEVARGSVVNLQQARADVKEIKTEGDFGMEVEMKESVRQGDELVAFTVTVS